MNWITKYIKENTFNWERILIDHDDNDVHCARIKFGKFLFKTYGSTLEESYKTLESMTTLIKDFIKNNPESSEAIEIIADGDKFKFEIRCPEIPRYISSGSYMFKEEAAVYGVAQMALFYKKQKEKVKKNGFIAN